MTKRRIEIVSAIVAGLSITNGMTLMTLAIFAGESKVKYAPVLFFFAIGLIVLQLILFLKLDATKANK